jgi:hypothetical protein
MVQQAEALIHRLVAAGQPTQLISFALHFVDRHPFSKTSLENSRLADWRVNHSCAKVSPLFTTLALRYSHAWACGKTHTDHPVAGGRQCHDLCPLRSKDDVDSMPKERRLLRSLMPCASNQSTTSAVLMVCASSATESIKCRTRPLMPVGPCRVGEASRAS